MHEFGLIEHVLTELTKRQDSKGSAKASHVRLRLSRWVSEEAVRQAFDMLKPGTRFESAKLEMEWLPTLSTPCAECGWIYHSTQHDHGLPVFICEDCGQLNPRPKEVELEVAQVIWGRKLPKNAGDAR